MGGENDKEIRNNHDTNGSSPRGRGKRSIGRRRTEPARLIPAWAGKTASSRRCSPRRRGSSPRGRGKRRIGRAFLTRPRLIPAWAGKTSEAIRRSCLIWAHPRVGGENRALRHMWRPSQGSSPRGRGKRSGRARSWLAGRLIPAWAGKTTGSPPGSKTQAAHPRVGGENRAGVVLRAAGFGSSPRGRGKRITGGRFFRPGRLIPAWAGKTQTGRVSL